MTVDEREKKLLYLSAPYSDPDPDVQQRRYTLTCRAAAKLMKAGLAVISPLANSIPSVELGGLELDHAGFMRIDDIILRRCDELVVLALDGWQCSKGVTEEIFSAIAQHKPVVLVHECDIDALPILRDKTEYYRRSTILQYEK